MRVGFGRSLSDLVNKKKNSQVQTMKTSLYITTINS